MSSKAERAYRRGFHHAVASMVGLSMRGEDGEGIKRNLECAYEVATEMCKRGDPHPLFLDDFESEVASRLNAHERLQGMKGIAEDGADLAAEVSDAEQKRLLHCLSRTARALAETLERTQAEER